MMSAMNIRHTSITYSSETWNKNARIEFDASVAVIIRHSGGDDVFFLKKQARINKQTYTHIPTYTHINKPIADEPEEREREKRGKE